MGQRTSEPRSIRSVGEGAPSRERRDWVAIEAPLEIRVGGRAYCVTMRTPGNDRELALGFLLSEGLIGAASDVAHMHAEPVEPDADQLDVRLATPDAALPARSARGTLTTSACGVCGIPSLESLRARLARPAAGSAMSPGTLASLPAKLRAAQEAFAQTGGSHAAGLFDRAGNLLCVREDVGRHNAVDKVVGWAALEGRLPLADHVLLVSGRASFEIVQKAVCAGIGLVASISAPSTLAIDLAEEFGLTLVGFLREGTMNVYAGAARLSDPGQDAGAIETAVTL